MKTLGIVQARCGAAKSDSKVGRKLGGTSLLEWVVRKATDCQKLDGVVVILGDSEADRAVAGLVPADVPVFLGPTVDVLQRLVNVANDCQAQAVMLIGAENPFVDPVLIDRLANTAEAEPALDYVSYGLSSGKPAILSPQGAFAEWCSTAALRRAAKLAKDPQDRQQATRYIYSHADQFQTRLLPLPAELDRDDVRLKVDVEEDWEHAQVIYEALGPDEWDWQRVAGLLDQQPALRKRMAVLNRSEARPSHGRHAAAEHYVGAKSA